MSYPATVNAVYTVYTMSKPIASARIPHSWHDQICAIATETGQTPSDVVKEAIGQYLGKTALDSQVGCVTTHHFKKITHHSQTFDWVRFASLHTPYTTLHLIPNIVSQVGCVTTHHFQSVECGPCCNAQCSIDTFWGPHHAHT